MAKKKKQEQKQPQYFPSRHKLKIEFTEKSIDNFTFIREDYSDILTEIDRLKKIYKKEVMSLKVSSGKIQITDRPTIDVFGTVENVKFDNEPEWINDEDVTFGVGFYDSYYCGNKDFTEVVRLVEDGRLKKIKF